MRFEFHEPGQWGFFDAGSRHEISNAGGARGLDVNPARYSAS